MLINLAVTVQLIRVFIFSYARNRFSHAVAHILFMCMMIKEPCHEKNGFFHVRKQSCRSAAQ